MRPSDTIENDRSSLKTAHRPSLVNRIRPGRSLLLFPAIVAGGWALLVAVFASASQLLSPADEGGAWGDVLGAVGGNFAIAFVVAFAVSVFVRAMSRRGTSPTGGSVDKGPPAPMGAEPSPRPQHHIRSSDRVALRVAKGGALGALPGLLTVVVPLLLADLDVISADQSQIGFIGVPLLIIGTLAGTATAASYSGCAGAVLLGDGAGFIIGLVAGVLIDSALRAADVEMVGIWLILTPLGMVAGAVVAVHLRLHPSDTTARGDGSSRSAR
jgi:hypothetical protein